MITAIIVILLLMVLMTPTPNKKMCEGVERKARSGEYKVFLDGMEIDPIGIDYYTTKYKKVVNEEDKTIIITSK